MDERALFTGFWENESKTTRNVIARIPEGSDYRPDPKSRTASEIAWQIVCEEKMIIDALETGKAEWAPPPAPATMKELLDDLREAERGHRPALEGAARRALGRHARVLRQPAAGVADGVELPLRHRAPPRADHDLPAPDGLEGPADLRTERRRAVNERVAGATPARRISNQDPTLFKQHRDEYYRLLDRVRGTGDWESWLDLFLEGVVATATGAVDTAQRLVALFKEDAARIQAAGRGAATTCYQCCIPYERPVITLTEVSRRTGLSFPRRRRG